MEQLKKNWQLFTRYRNPGYTCWGAKLIIRTDHRTLIFMKQCRYLNERITRWLLFIQQFDYAIEYIPGKENRKADLMSRFPQDKADNNLTNHPIVAAIEVARTNVLLKDLKNLKQLQWKMNL